MRFNPEVMRTTYDASQFPQIVQLEKGFYEVTVPAEECFSDLYGSKVQNQVEIWRVAAESAKLSLIVRFAPTKGEIGLFQPLLDISGLPTEDVAPFFERVRSLSKVSRYIAKARQTAADLDLGLEISFVRIRPGYMIRGGA